MMKRPNLAFTISIIFHVILFIVLMVVHKKESVRYGRPFIGIEFNVKAPEPKLKETKPKIEPVKFTIGQRSSNIRYSTKPLAFSSDPKMAVVTAARNVPVRGGDSAIPFGMSAPLEGFKTDTSFSDGAGRARGAGRYMRGGKSQLVDFVDKNKGSREIIYCVDISASMGASNKLNLSRSYLKDSLLALDEQDKFNMIAFAKNMEVFHTGSLLPATKENITKAMAFFDNYSSQSIKSNTKTDLLSPIIHALSMKPTIIVSVTDGLPTSGIIQPEKILQNIQENNLSNTKIFAIGMEMDQEQPEAWLMKAIAEQNNGEYQFF